MSGDRTKKLKITYWKKDIAALFGNKTEPFSPQELNSSENHAVMQRSSAQFGVKALICKPRKEIYGHIPKSLAIRKSPLTLSRFTEGGKSLQSLEEEKSVKEPIRLKCWDLTNIKERLFAPARKTMYSSPSSPALPFVEPSKTSTKVSGVVQAYAANTHKGIIR